MATLLMNTTSSKHSTAEEYNIAPSRVDDRIVKQSTEEKPHVRHFVNLHELPNYLELKGQVDAEVARMSWWESYGIDSAIHLFGATAAVVSFFIMRSDSFFVWGAGLFLLGCCHSILSVKGGHTSSHKAAVQSAPLNRLLGYFFSDICGSFPSETGIKIHIKEHHAYTNIIGIGDSSSFKAPFVPKYLYMFVTPFLIPLLTPAISVASLWGLWPAMFRFVCLASFGLAVNLYLFTHVSGFSLWQAVLLTIVSRAVLSVPYIHVNIFQHIGLPMYSLQDRPKKIYQMSTGVLNLSSIPLLDLCFGHSIISAHVEHHLFPMLSDQQCLRVKPIVEKFLKENGMAYNQSTYTDRLSAFLTRFPNLMQLAPPISHFVGIQ